MIEKQVIDELGMLNVQSKEITKRLEEGKNLIKSEIEGSGEIEGEVYKAKVSTGVRKDINEEMCLEVVKKNGIDWLIKEAVDLEKLEDAIVTGEVDPQLFTKCIFEKSTKMVTFTKRGGKK